MIHGEAFLPPELIVIAVVAFGIWLTVSIYRQPKP